MGRVKCCSWPPQPSKMRFKKFVVKPFTFQLYPSVENRASSLKFGSQPCPELLSWPGTWADIRNVVKWLGGALFRSPSFFFNAKNFGKGCVKANPRAIKRSNKAWRAAGKPGPYIVHEKGKYLTLIFKTPGKKSLKYPHIKAHALLAHFACGRRPSAAHHACHFICDCGSCLSLRHIIWNTPRQNQLERAMRGVYKRYAKGKTPAQLKAMGLWPRSWTPTAHMLDQDGWQDL